MSGACGGNTKKESYMQQIEKNADLINEKARMLNVLSREIKNALIGQEPSLEEKSIDRGAVCGGAFGYIINMQNDTMSFLEEMHKTLETILYEVTANIHNEIKSSKQADLSRNR